MLTITLEKFIYNATIKELELQEKRPLNSKEKVVVARFAKKQVIAKKFLPIIRKIYNNAIQDYLTFYKPSVEFDFVSFKKEYQQRFASALIDIYYYNSKIFGRQVRNQLSFAKYSVKSIEIDTQDKINTEYDIAITQTFLPAANLHASWIVDTMQKDIEFYTNKAQTEYQQHLQSLEGQLLATLLLLSQTTKQNGLLKKQKSLQDQIDNLKKDNTFFLKQQIKKNLTKRFKSRAVFTTDQEVGYSQSASQDIEASVIAQQEGELIIAGQTIAYKNLLTKEWISILDKKTRPAHIVADGQKVNISNLFSVGGELLKYPRDPNASIENIANCRCDVIYSIYGNY